jgi:hypothetical protein
MATETITLEMNWRAAANIIAAVLENGTPEGQASAREELARMADAADRARELAQTVADIREELKPVAEMNAADSDYVSRTDALESIMAAFNLATGRAGGE